VICSVPEPNNNNNLVSKTPGSTVQSQKKAQQISTAPRSLSRSNSRRKATAKDQSPRKLKKPSSGNNSNQKLSLGSRIGRGGVRDGRRASDRSVSPEHKVQL
jgi:hypothetical protein